MALVVKIPPANAGDIKDSGLIPWSRRSPRGGHGNPVQHSCLEYPMDRGAWKATVHGVTKSQIWLKWLSMQSYIVGEGPILWTLADSLCEWRYRKTSSGEASLVLECNKDAIFSFIADMCLLQPQTTVLEFPHFSFSMRRYFNGKIVALEVTRSSFKNPAINTHQLWNFAQDPWFLGLPLWLSW